MVVDLKSIARKRARWQGRANVDRFAEQLEKGHSAQRLKDEVEVDILRRFMRGERLLDVGIGTGRVSLPLLENGIRLTGVDASAAMIERCGRDARAASVRLVKGELEHLPFADEAFDTVISVDTFVHFPDWIKNLDELLRVTSIGGRVIVDVGSHDHLDAVVFARGSGSEKITAEGTADAYALRLSSSELGSFAAARGIALLHLVPYGAIFGSLVPNYWIRASYAFRSGAIDRLVSWIGTDPLLFAFAKFIERRIVQQLPPSVSGRMFAIFERGIGAGSYSQPQVDSIASCDERGPEAWHAEFEAHANRGSNCSFAIAFLLAAWPVRVSGTLRRALPPEFLRELDRTERSTHIDDICGDVVATWRSKAGYVAFHGVDLSDVLGMLLNSELRNRLDVSD